MQLIAEVLMCREHPREGFGVHEKRLPPGMAENVPWVLHSDWLTTIKYLSHSNSLITTSMDSCLLMLDFEKRHLKWSGKEHANGIYSCDYCRFIITLLLLLIFFILDFNVDEMTSKKHPKELEDMLEVHWFAAVFEPMLDRCIDECRYQCTTSKVISKNL